jgi:hypothetical protein
MAQVKSVLDFPSAVPFAACMLQLSAAQPVPWLLCTAVSAATHAQLRLVNQLPLIRLFFKQTVQNIKNYQSILKSKKYKNENFEIVKGI